MPSSLRHKPNSLMETHTASYILLHRVCARTPTAVSRHQTSFQICKKCWGEKNTNPRFSTCLFPQKNMQRPDLQRLDQCPPYKSVQPYKEPQLPPITQVLCQPIQMVFKRIDGGHGCYKLLRATSFSPAEKPNCAAQSPPTSEKSEGLCHKVLLIVLFEALQISSYSEERPVTPSCYL